MERHKLGSMQAIGFAFLMLFWCTSHALATGPSDVCEINDANLRLTLDTDVWIDGNLKVNPHSKLEVRHIAQPGHHALTNENITQFWVDQTEMRYHINWAEGDYVTIKTTKRGRTMASRGSNFLGRYEISFGFKKNCIRQRPLHAGANRTQTLGATAWSELRSKTQHHADGRKWDNRPPPAAPLMAGCDENH